MKTYNILCGGADLSNLASADHCLRLDVAGPDQNVNLRLTDVNRALLTNLPDLLVDLLELAAYVYCADQRVRRGSERLCNAGEEWRRHLRFVVPVRRLDVWASASVRDLLSATLDFLSDDIYEFEFVARTARGVQRQTYFTDLIDDGMFEPDDVVLFSGGVDSLAGTVESLHDGKRLVVIGHHSANKVVSIQKELVLSLRRSGFGGQLVHITVNVTNTGVDPVEPTQRSRSFLFASLAFVIARMFDLDGFTFYENGIVSLNLPIAGDVLGARATRTTHPKVIRGFEALFSELARRQIAIETPFLWLTKKEVIESLIHQGHGKLLAASVSCVHPIGWTKEVRHCGVCSQCIDRRFAVLAAGAEQYDAAEGYGLDLLMDDRRYVELDPATAYVRFAQKVAKLERENFQSEFPPASAALHSIPGLSASEALDRIWDLHRRHGNGVVSVLTNATRQYADDLVRGKIAPGSLVSLCLTRDHVPPIVADTTAQTAAFIDRLSEPTCEFAVDESGEKFCFRGGFRVDGVSYRLIRRLLDPHREAKKRNMEVPYRRAADLAEDLQVDEPTLRRRVARTRGAVEPRLAVDQGIVLPRGFIENLTGKGYRLSPKVREVALADIEPRCHD